MTCSGHGFHGSGFKIILRVFHCTIIIKVNTHMSAGLGTPTIEAFECPPTRDRDGRDRSFFWNLNRLTDAVLLLPRGDDSSSDSDPKHNRRVSVIW